MCFLPQVPLSDGCPVLLDVLFARQPEQQQQQQQQQMLVPDRRVLHVQSISSWAPSCIGPYSQVRRNTHLSLLLANHPVWLPFLF
jgi:hypothetical protein